MGLKAARFGKDRVRLTWQAPSNHLETAGYAVFRRLGTGAPKRLTPDLVTTREYVDHTAPAKGKSEYIVRAVERCGLYGSSSSPAWVDGPEAGVHLVDSYDVRGSVYVTPGGRSRWTGEGSEYTFP